MNGIWTAIIGVAGTVMAAIAIQWIMQALKSRSDDQVSYRDVVELIHATGHYLHSHAISYSHPNSSRQQQVTAYSDSDGNNHWIVKGPNGTAELFRKGKVVRNGDTIRLEHRETRRNLHSHSDVPSPLTGQQEVTAYGTNGIGDDNDNWRVELANGRRWRCGVRFRLIHVKTGKALHSHWGQSHPEHTAGQQEVTCYGGQDHNDYWEVVIFQHEQRAT